MEMWRCFLLLFSIAFTYAVTLVCAQDDPKGFISIDCGLLPKGSKYIDETTGLHYVSDASFIDSGVSQRIQANALEQQFENLRSFPNGTRNCYTLSPSPGNGSNKYLIRASFLYGNYDGGNQLPKFDLQLGVDTWGTIQIEDSSTPVRMEMIHNLTSNYVQVCLINTGNGTPFISSLELRLLPVSIYTTESGALQLSQRIDYGLDGNKSIRYKDDIYDRIWEPDRFRDKPKISNPLLTFLSNDFQVPSIVMSTAIKPPKDSNDLNFTWTTRNIGDPCYVYMHFAGFDELQASQSLKFDIYINEELMDEAVDIKYLTTYTEYSGKPLTISPSYNVLLKATVDSTYKPIINAIEVYTVKQMQNLHTDDNDVAGMRSIKETYGVQRNWQGDPCAPAAFVWDGLTCTSDGIPRVVSLNLTASGLTGKIASGISNLTMLKTLDLSYNYLTGKLPDFLAELSSLSIINLKGNNFIGPIPEKLLKKRDEGSLNLSIDKLTMPPKKKIIIILIVAAVILASFVLLALLAYLWRIRKKNRRDNAHTVSRPSEIEIPLKAKNQQLTYSDIKSITRDFQQVIGEGVFGVVYHGIMDKTQVAVKMLSLSSRQGYREIKAEAKILMNVNHNNLTRLVGYCHEGKRMGIIYEFMVNGNLRQHLSGEKAGGLGWQERLQIAIDAAQGLEYLHHGCKPSIIHRDVKSTNILLNEKFEAKLSDFGFSRVAPVEGGTHVSTIAADTPGYIDPKYFASQRLNEKSDVYSFGVVLMEVISGKPVVIGNGQENTSIVEWFSSKVQTGDVKNIADPRLKGKFNVSSFRQAVTLAMACTDENPEKRPTMTNTVSELKRCLAIDKSLDSKDRQLTYSDIRRITNDFEQVIGKGGFGEVYHGCMDETHVAVKMLSPSSNQGYKEFQTEAKILMNVNHRNVTRLVGYCYEGEHLGLIYEFMVNGNLRQHLSEEEKCVLRWKERLQIAINAAQGLEYLHHGCKPSIIHRDVKSTNILLNEKFEAKLADFGLSRVAPVEGGTHVSTIVAGTPGYIDPEYYVSNRLTEKSDVYSFGVVLMEAISGQLPVVIRNGQEKTFLVTWFRSMVQTADVRDIADPRLRGNFDVSSVSQAVKLAMACTDQNPEKRPTMTDTVIELKSCLKMDKAYPKTDSVGDSIRSPSTD